MEQRIFITGGASGLGKAVALRHARAGWRVAIGDVHAERSEETVVALRATAPDAFALRCDVRREEDLAGAADALVERWGGVDVVVNNAGVATAGSIEDTPISDWEWVLDIDLLGVVRGCKTFTPLFLAQGHGHFVNVASMAGLLDVPMMSSYNAAKAGVVSLSETLDQELRDRGIGVTLVCPSFFATNLAESLRTNDPRMRASMERLLTKSSITAEDIADRIFEAVRDGRFYVLPHAEARKAWRLKRLLPRALYTSLARRPKLQKPRSPSSSGHGH